MSASEIGELAAGMRGLGVTGGSTVALLLDDRPERDLCDAAARTLGATVTGEINGAPAHLVICDPKQLETVLAARNPTTIQHVVCLGGSDPRAMTLTELRDVAAAPGDRVTEGRRSREER